MEKTQVEELLLQALETEMGGIQVYQNALKAARNKELATEWEEYLEQTTNHERILRELLEKLGLDPAKETPCRAVVRHIAQSLVRAIELARTSGPPAAAELVAAECVVHAETKDHLNWELIGELVEKAKGEERK